MKKRAALNFALPFIGAIPVIVVSILEEQITNKLGANTFNVLMVISVIIVVVLSMFPFIGVFKGLFGGKGYNFFWGHGKLAKEVLATGKPAIATLKSINENSGGGITTINDQPLLYLSFQIEAGADPPYDVSFDVIVPRTVMPQLQPGTKIPVIVSKTDRNLVVFDKSRAGTTQSHVINVSGRNDDESEFFEQHGIDAMALLKSLNDTGQGVDNKLMMDIEYEVFIPSEEPYLVKKELPVPTDAIPLLRAAVGKTFKCKVHPEDRNRIAVDIRLG